jgi:asparagine synthase (glutamine-hydrolysing)
MCGIAGVFSPDPITPQQVNRVLNSLSHRGPDGFEVQEFKIHNFGYLNLFFSRLAILDLDARAMQPQSFMHLTILMNGEIYNYRELKDRIEEKFGLQDWSTTGDTEVALKYLAFFGVEAAKDLDGMFAIALWNHAKQELILLRDYFGEKPLYYYSTSNQAFFASEPKTIFLLNSEKPALNIDKISNFVVNGYKSIYKEEDDFFQDLKRVMPGQSVLLKLENTASPELSFYKSLPPEKPNLYESRTTAIHRIKRSVIKSIGLRLESDVPISISLSGGVDSCLIAAIAKKEFGVSLHAFTLESQDSRYSEAMLARSAAEFIGIDHTIVNIDSLNFLNKMREIIRYHDSPVSTISYYIQNFLMKEIHEAGFKVSLMGSGADELFSGYYDHHLLYLSELFEKDKSAYLNALENWKTHILPLIRNPIFRSPSLYIDYPDYRKHIFEGSESNRDLVKVAATIEFSENQFSPSLMRNRMLNELFNEVIPVILKEDDRNSMMYSVENRSPFLSYEILAECLRTDLRHFIHMGKTKSLLRDAFDGYLPRQVLHSYRKVGFNAGFTEICDVASAEFQEFLNDDSLFWEFVSREKAREIFGNVSKEDYFNKTAFSLVSSKVFVDSFSNG